MIHSNTIHRFQKLAAVVTATVFILSCGSTPIVEESADAPVTVDTPAQEPSNSQLTTNQHVQLERAVKQLDKGENKGALRILKSLHTSAPDNHNVSANYALALHYKGDTKRAKALAATASESALANNLLGLIALQEQQVNAATNYFKKAIAIDAKYAQAFYNLALIYDTYYQDLKNAVKFYQTYLVLIDFADEDTQKWVKELEASIDRE